MSAPKPIDLSGMVSGTPFECGQQIVARVIAHSAPHMPMDEFCSFARGAFSATLATLQALGGDALTREIFDEMMKASADVPRETH